MQSASYANQFRGQAFTGHASGYGASPGHGWRHHHWSRLHAAAVDRSLVERATNIDIEPAKQATKRAFDILLSVLLIAGSAPLLLLIAFLASRDGGPVLFGHRRLGAYGKSFTCWKFRTMVPDSNRVLEELLARDHEARAEWEETCKLKRDPRITGIGRFLRTTSLDELPQLFNVLKGEMSLVGPRPIVNDEIRRYGAAFHDYTRCRPGITGVWQVSGRNDVDYGGRVRMDKQYAHGWSLVTDIKLLWKTVFVVLGRRGAY
jgi:undecaprenyl-phosphate galactose phosphotransferase